MEFLIVRHARPEEQLVGSGFADPGLTEIGHLQARALAEYLVSQPIGHVVSSPMLRARQTAAPLSEILGKEIEIIDDLKESDHESSVYKPIEENREEMIESFLNDPDHLFGSDGRAAFFARVDRAFRQLAHDHAGETVAVFCHGMVTAAWLSTVLGHSDPFSLAPDYTGLTRVKGSAAKDVYSMRSFNETMHLKDLPDLRW